MQSAHAASGTAGEVEPRGGRIGGRDAALAALVALLAGALYAATQQTRLTGDGAGLAGFHVLGGTYYNILWLPAAGLLETLLAPQDPLGAPRLLGVLCGGLGVGLALLVARGFGAARRGAAAAALLLAVTPPLWFFATTIEVHALHFAAVGLCACLTLFAPWRRPALALALVAASFPLLFWTQQSSLLLGPGWVLLVQHARARKAAPFRWRTLLLGIGPLLLGMLLLAIAVANLVRFGRFDLSVTSQTELIREHFGTGRSVAIVWQEWAAPLGLLLVAALVGLARGGLGRHALAALAGLLLPPMAFFFGWGVFERGGYFLPSAIFLAALAARALDPLLARPGAGRSAASAPRAGVPGALVVAAAVLLQGWHARRTIGAYDVGFDVRERVALLDRLLPEGGTFVSTVEAAPPIAVHRPDVQEIDLWDFVVQAWLQTEGELDPGTVQGALLPHVERILAREGRVVVELGYRNQGNGRREELMKRHMEPLVRTLEERWSTRLVEDPWWPMLVVETEFEPPPQ